MRKLFYPVKIIRYAAALFVIITLNFFIPIAMPGDPLVNLLGEEARFLKEEDEAKLREEFGLHLPAGERYILYLKNLARLDMGSSIRYRRPVLPIITDKLQLTMLLLIPSLILGFILSVLMGAYGGWRAGSFGEKTATGFFIFIYAIPQYLLAMLAIYFFSYRMGLFPLGGFWTGKAVGNFAIFKEIIHHLLLPGIILVLSTASSFYLVVRNSVIQVSSEHFILYSKARGLSGKRILFLHVLKNALPPAINFAALNFGFIVSGALLVEIVFSLNGMGELILNAAIARDYPVLRGCLLILTLSVVGANLIADIICRLVDPRLGRGAENENGKKSYPAGH